MTDTQSPNGTEGNRLCKSCGLCCTGHLFSWTKLRSAELDAVESLGVKVIRAVPSQRGFNQPCPLWEETCTIYASADYPHFCRVYKCKLLKSLLEGTTSLDEALTAVQHTKALIEELDALLPPSQATNFRERVVAYIDTLLDDQSPSQQPDAGVRQKIEALLTRYATDFGVKDLVDLTSL